MPLFEMKCPRCGNGWEALVVRSDDQDQLICKRCGAAGEKQISSGVDWKICGFAARNGYGLKKFDDGR